MNTTIIFINLLALSCLIFAFVKDRAKTKPSLLIAVKSSFSDRRHIELQKEVKANEDV